jgi:hypothetical protein
MANRNHLENPKLLTDDINTLIAQTQDRLWRALKRRYQYGLSLKLGQEFSLII